MKKQQKCFSVRKQEMKMSKSENWILCPVCGNKTRLQIWTDTELINKMNKLFYKIYNIKKQIGGKYEQTF